MCRGKDPPFLTWPTTKTPPLFSSLTRTYCKTPPPFIAVPVPKAPFFSLPEHTPTSWSYWQVKVKMINKQAPKTPFWATSVPNTLSFYKISPKFPLFRVVGLDVFKTPLFLVVPAPKTPPPFWVLWPHLRPPFLGCARTKDPPFLVCPGTPPPIISRVVVSTPPPPPPPPGIGLIDICANKEYCNMYFHQ